jgi:hypothetical protein
MIESTPMHEERGRSRSAMATPSSPFCTTTTGTPSMTAVFAEMAASASCAFVHTSTRSGRVPSTSPASTRACAVPNPPLSRIPSATIAARPEPRAVTSTSCPARASNAANVPPSAPAPMMPILTDPA